MLCDDTGDDEEEKEYEYAGGIWTVFDSGVYDSIFGAGVGFGVDGLAVRVEFFVDFTEVLVGDVGVDLGS